jgi:CDP-paratose 2-epimerase
MRKSKYQEKELVQDFIHKKSPVIGVLEWFHKNDYKHVNDTIEHLNILGVKELRTGISWADYYTSDGQKWYDWLMPILAKNFNILPCFSYTPPSLGIAEKISSPPKDSKAYADFLDVFIKRYGQYFDYVELWNEPNNRSEYDFTLDQNWDIFSMMIIQAANWAKHLGKKTVLGGISPIHPGWIKLMCEKKVMDYIDVVGIHGFPDVFDSHWGSWEESITSIKNVLDAYNKKVDIWVTETGYSTWRYDERKQVEKFINVQNIPVDRVYWYSLYNIPFHVSTLDGLHIDEREYHFGMINEDGLPKLLYRLWSAGGIQNVIRNQWMTVYPVNGTHKKKEPVIITGGAGFIGTNVAHRLLNMGHTVYVFDNLSRRGAENNLKWLREQHKKNLEIIIADVRDMLAVENAIQYVSHVFHFAAQVAVTTSFINPMHDYSVNAKGTLNVLEAIRNSPHKPSLIFTSTNKVYGDLKDLSFKEEELRYVPEDESIENNGINELRRLDFHSPYGSSKGAADQYVLDYARSFGLKNIVFRMSCIYGLHQFGTEDQGWVAHFLIKALKNEHISIYGDGKQVRDILFIEDLVNAFLLAWENIDNLKGEVFNIGGGPDKSISLLELIKFVELYTQKPVSKSFNEWRKGDQKYYISDINKFMKATGWKPTINATDGIIQLYEWLKEYMYASQTQELTALE